MSNDRVVYGCPGAESNTGRAIVYNVKTFAVKELTPKAGDRNPGDFYGASVAISGDLIFVGEPLNDNRGMTNNGRVVGFEIVDSNLNSYSFSYEDNFAPHNNDQFGTSLALDHPILIIGVPNSASGTGKAYALQLDIGFIIMIPLSASDGAVGDLFGQNVAISGNTVVVGAGFNDEKGTDAGAAYVFVRNANGQWSQQQKLTASDARAGDRFGYGAPAIAIEANTIVVGAPFQDSVSSNPNDDRGAAYIFTRNLTSWTQQTKINNPGAFSSLPGNLFGDSVSISGDTVIVGAQRAASNDGTLNTGSAFVYRLDCVPPIGSESYISVPGPNIVKNATVCPGASVGTIRLPHNDENGKVVGGTPTSYQWRKNGNNIPGATGENYNIASVSASDAGTYDVIVSNACGSDISAPATLTVHTFSLNPTSQNFSASGSNSIVNVTSAGSCSYTATSNASWIKH